jgi:hypothetical protein
MGSNADDDSLSKAKYSANSNALAFQEVGSWLSFVSTAFVLLYLLRFVPEARQQMRPRLLMVLMGLDATAGLVNGLASFPTIAENPERFFSVEVILTFTGVVFTWASFTWTW